MSNILNVRSTYFPNDKLSERRWLRHIAGRDLNLGEIDQSTLIGQSIVAGYEEDPEGTVKAVKQMFEDNPEMVLAVIGPENVKKIR